MALSYGTVKATSNENNEDDVSVSPEKNSSWKYGVRFLVVSISLSVAILVLVTTSTTTSSSSSTTPFTEAADHASDDKESLQTCLDYVCPDDDTRPLSTSECTTKDLPAMGGVDLVDYFTTFKNADGSYDDSQSGLQGDSSITAVYEGYTFWFRSETSQALFNESPETYIPQYGGFCSWGMG